MKLKKTRQKYQRVFELYLIRNKVYDQSLEYKNIKDFYQKNLKLTTLSFKKSLYVIFKYHQKNKRILFLGVPKSNEIAKKINSNTKHSMISELFNSKNLNRKTKITLDSLNMAPDLIVVFDKNENQGNYESVIKDAYKNRTPLILLSESSNPSYIKGTYNVQIKNNVKTNNVFFNLIATMLEQTF